MILTGPLSACSARPVATATAERVRAAAAELGFAGPNPLASSLRQGRAGAIGVLVDGRLQMAFRDPFAIAVLDGLAEELEAIPTGMLIVPIAFSIMWSAMCGSRLPGWANCAFASGSSPAKLSTSESLSSGDILWKPLMRELVGRGAMFMA